MELGVVKRRGKKVQDAQIESKDQRWHCRNRVTLVFGSNHEEEIQTYLYQKDSIKFQTVNFHQAKSKAVEEILDNCIDEYYRGHVTEVHCTLSEDGKTVTVADNGIGMPLKQVQKVYSEFRTGSKFKDEDVDEKGFLHRTLGQNGLGASATCLTADLFKVTVKHYNTKKEQTFTFTDGALKVKKSKAKPFRGASGVKVEIVLSKEVYKNNIVDKDLLKKRVIDLAYTNPGLTFYFNKEKYLYKKGLFELAQRVNPKTAQLIGDESFIHKGALAKGKKYKAAYDISFSLTVDLSSDDKEKFVSFVNSSPTYDGGFHHDRIRRIFINTIKDKLERAAKKQKISIADYDVVSGLTFIVGITMPNPRFESQTKRKLVKDSNLDKFIEKFMEKNMKKFLRNNPEYLEVVVDRAKVRHKFQELKDASKRGRKQKKIRVEKLLDANERKQRDQCTLFICEGDSAIGGLRSARDKLYQGGIALKGKPLNVAQASIKDILNNQELSDIMASVGLTIGQKPDPSLMRYSKVVFLADSDVDGGHINTLLTNFFFSYWPELFEMEAICIARAPLFEVITDAGTLFVESPAELESVKNKKTIKIKEIQRNKGLGEMSTEAWKYVLGRDKFTAITTNNAADSKEMLEVCFGKDTGPRKDLLMDDGSPGSARKANKKTKSKANKKVTKKVTKKKKKKK